MEENIGFRPITEGDLPFLGRVYASTREEELSVTGWTPDTIRAFLASQFQAQHRYYREQFASASYQVILVDGREAGRLYIDRRESEIRIIDIALLPEFRGRGIGSHILGRILDEASRAGKPVRIHVEMSNPAMSLYQRLGFRKIDEHGLYHLMEWTPQSAVPVAGPV